MTEVLDETRAAKENRAFGWLLSITGLIGFVAALVLSIERYKLLLDPSYVPSCSINPVLSCGNIMSTDQAALLGFPNPFIGLAGFAALVMFGVFLVSGVKPAPWLLRGLLVGSTLGMALIAWLSYQSLYVIGALCPYCMVVWVVMSIIFWKVLGVNLSLGMKESETLLNKVRSFVSDYWVIFTGLSLTLTIILVLIRFWYYWSTLLG